MRRGETNDETELINRFESLLNKKPLPSNDLLELIYLSNETPAALGLSSLLPGTNLSTQAHDAVNTLLAPFAPPKLHVPSVPAPALSTEDDTSLMTSAVIRAILRNAPEPPEEAPRTTAPPPPPMQQRRPAPYQRPAVEAGVRNPTQTIPHDESFTHPALAAEFSQSPLSHSPHKRPAYDNARHRWRPPAHTSHLARQRPAAPERPAVPERPSAPTGPFRTAKSKFLQDKRKRLNQGGGGGGGGDVRDDARRPAPRAGHEDTGAGANVRTIGRAVLGAKRPRLHAGRASNSSTGHHSSVQSGQDNNTTRDDLPEIPNVEPRLVEMIMNEMLDRSPGVEWDDIAGLQFAKRCVMEAIVWPMKRPDIFTGLRGPPKGLLLFGPPGTGKTLIGRAIASRSGAKFFNISASSLMSKWVGEGEKLVRALFAVAREMQPAVVFIDEIDSLLTQRSESDQEGSRRIKTEFLVQMDGAGTSRDDRVLVVGATNRPQELDEAARRRLVKRLYIPLPDGEARRSMVMRLLEKSRSDCNDGDFDHIVTISEGYSGSDMYALCAEAALGPVRDLGEAIGSIEESSVRPIARCDFDVAAKMVRASVSNKDLDGYVEWNKIFGSFPMDEVTRKE